MNFFKPFNPIIIKLLPLSMVIFSNIIIITSDIDSGEFFSQKNTDINMRNLDSDNNSIDVSLSYKTAYEIQSSPLKSTKLIGTDFDNKTDLDPMTIPGLYKYKTVNKTVNNTMSLIEDSRGLSNREFDKEINVSEENVSNLVSPDNEEDQILLKKNEKTFNQWTYFIYILGGLLIVIFVSISYWIYKPSKLNIPKFTLI